MRTIYHLFFFIFWMAAANSQTSFPYEILDEQQRGVVTDAIIEHRLQSLLPELMEETQIDMWIIVSREYNEDPVLKTMLPAKWLSARRRTMLVFVNNGDGTTTNTAIARYDVGKLMKGEWDLNVYPDQWDALVDLIKKHDPKKIGVNISDSFALADGLVKTDYDLLMKNLPTEFQERIVSAENLAVRWLETRTQKEIEIYERICEMAHYILREGLSEKVIHPGITTTSDVEWKLRNRVTELGLKTWFHPSVSIQRADEGNQEFLRSFSKRPEQNVIHFGDLVHVDFGITYLRLNTDQQEHFYVLHPSENEPPEGLQMAFERGKELQNILTGQFIKGRTGNQILKAALDRADKNGLVASIYTHPIGYYGHAAGPTIGMWDKQEGVPGTGDYPLFANTAYSIELFAASEVPEWNGKIVRIMLEQDGLFTGSGFYYLDGRQEKLWTIPRR